MKIIRTNHSILLACFLSLTAARAETTTITKKAEPILLGTTMAGKKIFSQLGATPTTDTTTLKNRQEFVQALAAEPALLLKIRQTLAAISLLETAIASQDDAAKNVSPKERQKNVLKLLFRTCDLKHFLNSSATVREACVKATSLLEQVDALDEGEAFIQRVLKNPATAAAFYGELDVYVSTALLLASNTLKALALSK